MSSLYEGCTIFKLHIHSVRYLAVSPYSHLTFTLFLDETQTDPNAPAQTQDVVVNIDEPTVGEDAPEKPEGQVCVKRSARNFLLSYLEELLKMIE